MIAHQLGPLVPVLPLDPLLPFGAYLGFASNRPGQFVPMFPLGPPLPHPPLEAAPVLAQFPPFLLMTPVQLAPLLPLPPLQIPHKLPPSHRRRLIPGIPARRDMPAADLRVRGPASGDTAPASWTHTGSTPRDPARRCSPPAADNGFAPALVRIPQPNRNRRSECRWPPGVGEDDLATATVFDCRYGGGPGLAVPRLHDNG